MSDANPHKVAMEQLTWAMHQLHILNRQLSVPIQDVIANDVINPDNIEVTFSSIGGLTDVKQSLHDLVILPLVRPELFANNKLLR